MNSPRLRLGREASERQNKHLLGGQTKRKRLYFCTHFYPPHLTSGQINISEVDVHVFMSNDNNLHFLFRIIELEGLTQCLEHCRKVRDDSYFYLLIFLKNHNFIFKVFLKIEV